MRVGIRVVRSFHVVRTSILRARRKKMVRTVLRGGPAPAAGPSGSEAWTESGRSGCWSAG